VQRLCPLRIYTLQSRNLLARDAAMQVFSCLLSFPLQLLRLAPPERGDGRAAGGGDAAPLPEPLPGGRAAAGLSALGQRRGGQVAAEPAAERRGPLAGQQGGRQAPPAGLWPGLRRHGRLRTGKRRRRENCPWHCVSVSPSP